MLTSCGVRGHLLALVTCLAFGAGSIVGTAESSAQKAGVTKRAKGKKKGDPAAAASEAPAGSGAPASEPPPAGAPAAAESKGATGGTKVVGETEDKTGVKTYKFGAQEVEGRLKSPQVSFFLRRVRAEFAAGELGHRSFMRELSHTRHDASLR